MVCGVCKARQTCVVEIGTLSGMPLFSYGCYFRKIAWHQVRTFWFMYQEDSNEEWIVMWQIKQLNEPTEDKITEWNTGGLLTRIEGFRGFIPKQEMVKKVNIKLFGFTVLCLLRLLCVSGEAVPSRRTSWMEPVAKILPYGAQVKLGDGSRTVEDVKWKYLSFG
ncbi:LOW QUALITY PROTEIN: hypothetical protein HID58_054450, partial [Brassica napus]